MRMRCNGCRVLRKGCSENCSIRHCLQWIKSAESQSNATVFLAKFYGRAGLMNLINAGPDHLRPALFRSLLYEACGRIVNPIYGSVGLLWSGSWQFCQAAVDAVLKGDPILLIPTEAVSGNPGPLKAYDIRHVAKAENSAFADELHKIIKTRNRFKRSGKPNKPAIEFPAKPTDTENDHEAGQVCDLWWGGCCPDRFHRASSEASNLHSESNNEAEADSIFSNETVEASLLCPAGVQDRDPHNPAEAASNEEEGSGGIKNDDDLQLELTLGFEPVSPKADQQHDEPQPEGKAHVQFEASVGLELTVRLTCLIWPLGRIRKEKGTGSHNGNERFHVRAKSNRHSNL